MASAPSFSPAVRAISNKEGMWEELGALAREVKPLDLGIGCPDFAAPQSLRQDFKDVVNGDDFTVHQYTKAFGHPRLCRALSSLYAPLFARPTLNPATEITITNGATEALFVCLMGLVNPGDEVIIIEPFFDCYEPQVKLAGGTPVFVPLRPDAQASLASEWKLDLAELEAAFTSSTKAIVINNPHNPTGKVFSRSELEAIAALCLKYDVIVISDEVYEWLTYDGVQHVRMATLPGMWDRTITIGSAGKTFSVTGWKVGWMIGPAQLLIGPKVIHQHCGYIGVTPIQEALSRGFERETDLLLKKSSRCYLTSLPREAEAKRDRLVSILSDSGIKPIVPQGGFFILADVREVMKKIDVGGDPKEPKDFRFVKWMSRNRKLQVIPPSGFFTQEHKHIGEDYIRLCFLKEDATLDSAGVILRALGEELRR